jgi:probable rRNA maturation factor
MKLVVVNQSSVKVSGAFLRRRLKEISRQLVLSRVRNRTRLSLELTVVFLNTAPARKLNLQFRGRNYATDVLSFSGDQEMLGELALCPQVILKQAREHDLSFEDELTYMILHGILHLLDYDHEQGGPQAKLMLDLQDRIFARLRRDSV